MSQIDDTPLAGDDGLILALRSLRRDVMPERDLWPQIAARIAKAPFASHGWSRTAARWAPWALAASVLLALGLAWQMRGLQWREAPSKQGTLIAHEAQALSREYHGALRELAASTAADHRTDPTLLELDRSAAQIRSALARDPDARFLLDRLRHTYSLRLALTQRAVLT